jgi:histone-lysine N-methyltransferase SUV39H
MLSATPVAASCDTTENEKERSERSEWPERSVELGKCLVEEIIDMRPSDAHYLVRWVGYPQPTWEPLGCLAHCREALNDYVRRVCSATPLAKFRAFEEGMRLFEGEFRKRSHLIQVVNEVDFEAPPTVSNDDAGQGELRVAWQVRYGERVTPPQPDFLAGCSENCACSGGPEPCTCLAYGDTEAGLNPPYYTKDGRLVTTCGPRAVCECNVNCRCKSSACCNRVVQAGAKVALEITKLGDERGWGVFAAADIPQGTFIDRYHGEVITAAEAERRTRNGLGAYLFDMDWATGAAVIDGPEGRHGSATRRGQRAVAARPRYTIDARTYGSLSRFLNHSCEPNLRVQPIYIETHDPHMHGVAFFTARDVLAGEQLTFDYFGGLSAHAVFKTRRKCLCGATSCRSLIFI